MNRYVCVHGHFYQPPRENPWLEAVELQDSAFPYHDWNERIAGEAYAPNTASRILDGERRIINIVNNFSAISFNIGPTLFSWLEARRPDVYEAILEADRASAERFSGHGGALAQVYNHMIMPLANRRDRRTQVLWGIRDFETRFGRRPEGMWLPETAVDSEILELLAEQSILFTVLAPSQAARVRPLQGGDRGGGRWQDVSGARIDPRMPYLCRLHSGGSITLFFYDGPISQEIGFGALLDSGEAFAGRLASAFEQREESQLVHVATDGETYGHHRPFGDMALAYCLYHLESAGLARITVYGEYLERHPPTREVQIFDNSSWSCVHGVERWRAACGCSSGMNPGWQQQWRAPLRAALDRLRDSCVPLYESQASALFRDPWEARDHYIEVLLDRSPERVEAFLKDQAAEAPGGMTEEQKVRALSLLEQQRSAMLMYTSCGWFFDEISGIETVQVMQYAERALQLAEDLFGVQLESAFKETLAQAPSNLPRFGSGAGVYETLVRPARVDLLRVGAHYAVSSLLEEYPETADLFCYRAKSIERQSMEMGKLKMVAGRVELSSQVTLERQQISFAVLHLGGHLINGGVREFGGQAEYGQMLAQIKEAFQNTDIAEIVRLMDDHFGTHNYSIRHLFRDEQRKFFRTILEPALQDIRLYYRRIYEENGTVLLGMNEMGIPIPEALTTPLEFILNRELREHLEADPPDIEALSRSCQEFSRWPARIDQASLALVASRRAGMLLEALSDRPEQLELLSLICEMLELLRPITLPLNLWQAQNSYFRIGSALFSSMQRRAEAGDSAAGQWLQLFDRLGRLLTVKVGS
jgi:alpha-amylase/alpha-mannosidase (GH57 family)